MKIAITGASGFVGAHLASELLKAGHQLSLFGKEQVRIEVPDFGFFEVAALDILDKKNCESEIYKVQPDAVIHLAGIAQTNSKDVELLRQVNITGALNVAKSFCKAHTGSSPKPFLFISSAFVYGNQVTGTYVCNESSLVNPRGAYGQSKIEAEMELSRLSASEISVYVARPFNHIGVGQDSAFVVPALIKRFKEAKPHSEIPTGGLESFRDFTDVRDVVKAYRLIIEKKPIEKLFVIGSGKSRAIKSIFDLLNEFSQKSLRPLTTSDLVREESQARLEADSSLAKRVLGWEASISFETSLKQVWDHEFKN